MRKFMLHRSNITLDQRTRREKPVSCRPGIRSCGNLYQIMDVKILVPLAGIEPALLSEPDFESGASTNSAKGATGAKSCGMAPDYTNEPVPVNRFLQKSAIHETLLDHCVGRNIHHIYIPACTGLQVTA
jgi:hypothetical protein